MLLQIAPENEDQVGEAGREALAYWFAIHIDFREVGSVLVHLARDWVECGAEGGLAKARRLATRTVDVVFPLVMEAVAMVRQRSLYRHLGARQKSRRLIADEIHLNTNETRAKGGAHASIHFNLPPALLLRSSFGCNPRKVVIHPQSSHKSFVCI